MQELEKERKSKREREIEREGKKEKEHNLELLIGLYKVRRKSKKMVKEQ